VLAAAASGVELQMLPLLGGFFTYKLAVIGRWAAGELAAWRAPGGARPGDAAGRDAAPAPAAGSSEAGGYDARSVDRVFNKGMLAR